MTLHRVVLGEDIVHVADLMDDDAYRSRLPTRVALVDLGGARTQLIVSLRKDNRLIGVIMVYRREVRRYTDKQIALCWRRRESAHKRRRVRFGVEIVFA